jgi:hypothetical protein
MELDILFLDRIEHGLCLVMEQLSGDSTASDDRLDSCIIRCERMLEEISVVESTEVAGPPMFSDLYHSIELLSSSIQELRQRQREPLSSSISERRPAHRPRLRIGKNQLEFLVQCGFRLTEIANLFRCSVKTIQRRIVEYNLTECTHFSLIGDDELDQLTDVYVQNFPAAGAKTYQAFLHSQGLKIQRYRVRESMIRVDGEGVCQRRRRVLTRRVYSVPMPNSLWHIDGYHKLIRWNIVIHGGIDGYSRLPVFLSASSNNKAATVLRTFLSGVQQYGLPSRIRCDKGGENILVCLFMLCHPDRGPGRRSCITGRSVHNQRIERFWRDLYSGCMCYFYHLFYQLEDIECLDPANAIDMFCLHRTFLPAINHQLRIFQEVWSHHHLRTCGHSSPIQLFIQGYLRSGCAGTVPDLAALQSIQDVICQTSGCEELLAEIIELGIHSGDPQSIETIQTYHSVYTDLQNRNVLQLLHDPSEYTMEEAVELYLETRQFILSVLN